jgi:hypothetical protein
MTGKENFWFFISTTPTVSPAIQNTVTEHFQELGFTAPVAIEGKSAVFMKKFFITADSC